MSIPVKTTPILIDLPDVLHGPRLLVRPYRAGDGAALWEAVEESREHIRPWLPWGPMHQSPADSEASVRRWQAKWLTREDLAVGLWDKATGRFLGGSGLHRINWDIPSFEIGYWLRQTAEGHGYMTEAGRLLCSLAFKTLGAQRVIIRCEAGNARSAAVAQRLGFVQEGILRNESRDTSGDVRDMALFAMTPGDYDR